MDAFHGLWDCFESLEFLFRVLLELHDGGQVVASVAVVGDTPDGN